MIDIGLTIDGTDYSGWESLDVTISMETLSGVFNLSMSDNIGGITKPVIRSPQITPGQSGKLTLNGQTVITGYVDKVSPQYSADSHTIIVQGRDKSGDLVDCSMIQPVNQWKNLKLEQLITNICQPFGIPVTANVDTGLAIDYFVIEQGATCFESIQKLCAMRQCLAISDGKGGLTVTRSGTNGNAKTDIVEGMNIISASADYDFSQRYNTYLCKGQKQGDDNSTPQTVALNAASVNDSVVNRYRPLLIIYDGQGTIQDCQLRATWEAAVRRGKSIKITVTVVGWTQSDGSLWAINTLVNMKSTLLGINQSLLISSINFKLDENGQLAVLTLTSPEAYTIGKQVVQKSNPYLT